MPSPPDTPPEAVQASWVGATAQMLVTFDQALVDQPLSAANWLLTLADFSAAAPSAAAVQLPDGVLLTFSKQNPALSIAYSASPADVVGAPPDGLPASAFALPVS